MRIFVFSDSHGLVPGMAAVLAEDTPDLIIHLGDHVEDALSLSKQTAIPLLSVSGNSLSDSISGAPYSRTVELAGHRLYLCHGHLHRVKSSLLSLAYAAKEQQATLALFGHTHTPCDEQFDGARLINPGSARDSFAVLTLTPDWISCEHRSIHQP